jgi:hypothetical protein
MDLIHGIFLLKLVIYKLTVKDFSFYSTLNSSIFSFFIPMLVKSLTMIESIAALLILAITVTGVVSTISLARREATVLKSDLQLSFLISTLAGKIAQSTSSSSSSSCDHTPVDLCSWEQYEQGQILNDSFFQERFPEVPSELFQAITSSSYQLKISKIAESFDRTLPSSFCPHLDKGCTYETCPLGQASCTFKNFIVTVSDLSYGKSDDFEVFKEVL